MFKGHHFAYLGGAAAALLIVYLVMPTERADQISDSLKRLSGDAGMKCLDYHRQNLKDPDSAKLLGSRAISEESGKSVEITYKAQNSYGAFVKGAFTCVLARDGNVDATMTRVNGVISEMRQKNDCLERQIAARREGNPSAESVYSACMSDKGM